MSRLSKSDTPIPPPLTEQPTAPLPGKGGSVISGPTGNVAKISFFLAGLLLALLIGAAIYAVHERTPLTPRTTDPSLSRTTPDPLEQDIPGDRKALSPSLVRERTARTAYVMPQEKQFREVVRKAIFNLNDQTTAVRAISRLTGYPPSNLENRNIYSLATLVSPHDLDSALRENPMLRPLMPDADAPYDDRYVKSLMGVFRILGAPLQEE